MNNRLARLRVRKGEAAERFSWYNMKRASGRHLRSQAKAETTRCRCSGMEGSVKKPRKARDPEYVNCRLGMQVVIHVHY